ncbi:undecaprenyl-diphosphate phosphatase [Peptoniphilus lacrimalis]|uniref:undecaprenyl-diphosphate phosphatase n=1 Tax=Peptoniphilus lacrimalis TaxID=33031 RepID=UPI00254BD432|nr:undecaprenyl-diphosphate phosphatase [Peptoniphilus lacrimalis]MDK7722417.1 undecaprenyl-diphosphate phosphatase [Peptoniphilus lacrimalis]MDK7732194.1 undecaprenyl-diphosphate phosphatase [Peptoniphilus lacrimalis]
MIFDLFKVLILGIVEGLTEFLPISSTGHLILFGKFIELSPKEFSNAFFVIIQLGAILSVLYLYFNDLNPIGKYKIQEKVGDKYKSLSLKDKWELRDMPTMRLLAKIIIGFLPAAVLGFLFDDLIDKYLFNEVTVSIALIFYGIIIILMEKKNKDSNFKYNDLDDISLKTAFFIGVFQCLAMVPGTSRSAATIIGAMLLGCSRTSAAKFSFYLAIPTMLGATALKVIKIGISFSLWQWFLIIVGGIVSYIVALIVIKKFLSYIRNNDFTYFGIYRIILGILVLFIRFI